MYQVLYRKWRPKTFDEVTGQEHITTTLKNEIIEGRINHAYLFTGSRGTGKTTCAKILAKAVNCLNPQNGNPCGECEICRGIDDGSILDIVEMDAASNRNIDDIRQIIDEVNYKPARCKYRVYIVDEVHMLTVSAFNALLKTLEEPPAHVVFILATTEVHKLPATILSRCQRFDFRRIEADRICERIQYIADKEGLTVTDGAASLIAAAADGGMRDALSILDLCASGSKNIDEETVESVCGMAGGDYLIKLADYIKSRNAEGALVLIDRLYGNSVDMQRLLAELTSHYRDLMIIKTVKGDNKPIVCSSAKLKALEEQAADYDIKDIMRTLSALQAANAGMQSGNRRCEMEMTVIRLCTPSLSYDLASLERRIAALENGTVRVAAVFPAPTKAAPAPEKPTSPPQNDDANHDDGEIPLPEYPADEPQISAPKSSDDGGITPVDNWDEVLRILKTSCPLIAGVLKGSAAYIKGQYLLIDAPNGQFRSLINSGNGLYKDSIRKAAQTVLGVTYKLGPYTAAAPKAEEDPLAALADRLKNFEIN